MIDPTAKLSISRQAIVLGFSRGAVYYKPRPVSDADLKLMHRIDKLHMEFPFAGSRMLQGLLVQDGFKVGRLHVATLMTRMGIEALYRQPNTSKPAPGHKIYPYLLRKPPITRPNQVWAMDITYIPPLGRFALQIACRAMDGARIHLSRRRAGLVHTPGPGVARVDHAGSGFLHRSSERGACASRCARDLQHGQSYDQCQFPGGLTLTPIDHPLGWCRKASRRDLTLTPIDPTCVFPWTCRSPGNALRRGIVSKVLP